MGKYKDTKLSYYILWTPAGVNRHVVPRASRVHGPYLCPADRGAIGSVRLVCPLIEELGQHVR
jgi:hypothetical protein